MKQERATYMIATRQGRRIADSFVLGGDFGWFCPACPTIVINGDRVSEMLGFGKQGWNIGSEWAPLGLVDLDAVPESKRHLPLGTDDNPYPLVEFIHSDGAPGGPPALPGRAKEKHKPNKKERLRAKKARRR
ncbi:MAG: hypothetical protein HYZ49_09970 [Chloroflexi bacterium]|nr:hypothetical protein [Chloroflexota bacterium]